MRGRDDKGGERVENGGGMERVGGGVRRVEHCIGGVWGWSIRGQSFGRGVRGWGA